MNTATPLTLLTAMALTAAAAAQGSLAPPPGAPVANMKSLQELWDRIGTLQSQMTALQVQNAGLVSVLQHLRWTARPSRHYRILASPDLAPGSWQPTGSALFSSAQGLPITGSAPIPGGAARRFFRVEVIRPLAP